MLRLFPVFFSIFLSFSVCQAQAPANKTDPAKLTLDRIYASEDFRGDSVERLTWQDDGTFTLLLPSKKHKNRSDLVRQDAAGKIDVLVPAEQLIAKEAKEPLSIQGYQFSQDQDWVLIYTNSVKVWRQNTKGDYWLFHRSTGELHQVGLGKKPSELMYAKLSPDGTQVGYVYQNNLYVEPVAGGPAKQLTRDGNDEIINGNFDWVYEEEFACRDGWRWSDDSQSIAYWQLDTRGVPKFTMINNTDAKYPKLQTFAYPKTGEQNSLCRVGVITTTGGDTTWLNIPGDTRHDYYIPRVEWLADSAELQLLRLNRLQNAVDVMIADAKTGQTRIISTDRDGAWLDLHDDAMQWLDGGQSFTWISERSGWRQLYVISKDGRSERRVSPGGFDIIEVLHIDEKANRVYVIASPENPTQRYLYEMPLDGKSDVKRLTPASQLGWHDYNIAPTGQVAIHTFSAFGQVPVVELISLPDHKTIRTLADNQKLQATIDQLAPCETEFFQVKIAEDVSLDGWMMKPPNFDPAKKYPLFFYVYGEPAGQTVTDRWGGNNYLWHRMLTQQGYIVACMDNRGTPCPKGRDWRKSVYRKIGVLASADQAAATKQLLKDRPYLDPQRVGIWGWSGGGSMTLNLLFRTPEIYTVGMSVAPVPDMRLYDTIYQERYMGLPQQNEADYERGSPITHASGLKGKLLVVHGTGDDNCHYQGVEKLSNKLIELNKPFRMMAYPNRSHSIREGKNTTRHLFELLTEHLQKNLPAGPR